MDKSKEHQKIMLVLVDGISDRGIPQLGGKTPMQHLNLPMHDLVSKSGQNGLMDSVEPGYGCGSDTSHMNIFGYSPFVNYRGRGAFETMGSGLPMVDGDIAFKCNFAHMDENKVVKLRRVDRDFPQWGLPLIDNLNKIVIPGFEEYKVSALHATEHRIGLKISGPDLTNDITGTDCLKDNLKLLQCESTEPNCAKSQKTADLVNALSVEMNKVLEKDPINLQRAEKNLPTANIVLLRGCGIKISQQPFEERHGIKGWATCPTCILNGLSQSINFDTYKVDGATGDYHENLFASAEKAMDQFLNGETNEKGEKVDYQFGQNQEAKNFIFMTYFIFFLINIKP